MVEILTTAGQAIGAACLDEQGEQVNLLAGAVVLATGGLGRLFPVTSKPPAATGDGYALGYRAGARLRDLEFVQFTPAGLVHPETLHGYSLSHELLAHPQARVLDGAGEQLAVLGSSLAQDLDQRLELLRQFHDVIEAGRTSPHGGLCLDLRDIPAPEVDRLAPGLNNRLLPAGLNPARDLLEVAPEVHFTMGGFDIDLDGQTSVPGLYAAGETVGGCHGANRLTHNAFPEIIVLAPRAGQAAAARARHLPAPSLPAVDQAAQVQRPGAPPALLSELRATMLAAAGPVRTKGRIASGLARLAALRSALDDVSAKDARAAAGPCLEDMCQVTELVMLSSLRRQESRGCHYRRDCPARDDARWLVNIMVEKGSAGPRFLERPVDLAYIRPQGLQH